MDARRKKYRHDSPGTAPLRRPYNLSLDRERIQRLDALALLQGTSASKLVTAWIDEKSRGLVFYQKPPALAGEGRGGDSSAPPAIGPPG